MSSETLLQLMEDPPAILPPPADLAAASPATPPAPALAADDDLDSSGASRAPALHARRLLAARDINAKIENLEQDIADLSVSVASSQANLKGVMNDLQSRSSSMMADLMRVSSRLEKEHQQQGELHRTLDQRLTGSISELGRDLDQTAAMLQAQKDCLARLQDSHDMLQRLHSHLDKVVSRQGHSLGILATDTHQQLQITRSHIEALDAFYHEQQEMLLALTSDHELLALKSGQLEARVTGIDSTLTATIGQTRQRFRTVAVVIAVLAVISLGLITYFQLYPSAVPETVRQQLAGLSSGLSRQSSSSDALRQELVTIQERMSGLDARLGQQAGEIASLRSQARQTARNLKAIRDELSSFRAELEAGSESLTPATESITTPVALPGTRASL
ncbi:MAG: damX [Moraxellaceae bacterium]|jgi:chromosome segregation ATPase|nr:damX [Moraxellaceae bacterium]